MASTRSNNPGRKPVKKSQKLDGTLKELENAFEDWESLGSAKIRQAQTEDEQKKAAAVAVTNQEFVDKTKKLLSELREQLAELTD